MTSTTKKNGPNIGAIVIVALAVGVNLLLSKLMADIPNMMKVLY